MIESNQNDFAGAVPVSEPQANWNWMKERVPSSGLEDLNSWLEDQLSVLEASCEDWVTPKSLQLAQQKELRDSRS